MVPCGALRAAYRMCGHCGHCGHYRRRTDRIGMPLLTRAAQFWPIMGRYGVHGVHRFRPVFMRYLG